MPDGLSDRILAPLLTAVQRCVDQGVVADPDLADAGVIFGTGFAPWTGGPLHHVASLDLPGPHSPPSPHVQHAPTAADQSS